MNLKFFHKKFQDEIEKRGVEYLIHFTTTSNLSSIFKEKKILSRSGLEFHDLVCDINDPTRSDRKKQYINVSLSGPNSKLFSVFRRKCKSKDWCVLKIDPKHIYDQKTRFSVTNAASNHAKWYYHISYSFYMFKMLFNEKVETKYGAVIRGPIHPKYPTCVQAEILVHEIIPLESIIKVCFESEKIMTKTKKAMSSLNLDTSKFTVDKEVFSPNRYRLKAEEKYRGSLKLAAIGDALGWMTEFKKIYDSLKKEIRKDCITEFHKWKKHVGGKFYGYTDNIKSGSYSDDTQLLLSVARSINSNGSVDQDYFAKKELPDWLLYSRGAGRTVKNAAKQLSKKKPPKWNENFFGFKVGKTTIDYNECGANGAAMRILPIALANFGNSCKIKKEIFANSIITHGHPRAILGAMLYGYAINTILSFHPDNFSYKGFLTKLGKDIHQKFSVDFLDDPKLKSWENEWNKNLKKSFKNLFWSILDDPKFETWEDKLNVLSEESLFRKLFGSIGDSKFKQWEHEWIKNSKELFRKLFRSILDDPKFKTWESEWSGSTHKDLLRPILDDLEYKIWENEWSGSTHKRLFRSILNDPKYRDWENQWIKNLKELFQKLFRSILDDPKYKDWEECINNSKESLFRSLFISILVETQYYLRTVYKSINDYVSYHDVLTKLGCYNHETKGSGTSTVIAGIYLACKYSKDAPLKGIKQAVNSIGTDTDSIAAFAGGLIGALRGQAIIPKKWKDIQDLKYIEETSIRLLEINESRAEEIKKPIEKEVKSIRESFEEKDDVFFESLCIGKKIFLETLNEGEITLIDKQEVVTKGKYTLIFDVEFKVGQSCRFVKRLYKKEGL